MWSQFESEAYDLISLLTTETKQTNPPSSSRGSFREKEKADFTLNVDEIGISRVVNSSDLTVEIYGESRENRLGFGRHSYPRFRKLVENIHVEWFSDKVSFETLETEVFHWMLDIQRNQKSNHSLQSYTEDRVATHVNEHVFYFPVLNLDIEDPIDTGRVLFMFFTRNQVDKIFEDWKAKNKQGFDSQGFNSAFRSAYQGTVLAKTTVVAGPKKAEIVAKQRVKTAVSTLKIYGPSMLHAEDKTMFDPEFNIRYPLNYEFLSKVNPSEDYDFSMNKRMNGTSFYFSNRRIARAMQAGLGALYTFINRDEKNEVSELITQAINLLGDGLSTFDLHDRCVKVVTILESLFLRFEDKYQMEKKVKKRIGKLLVDKTVNIELYKEALEHVYSVRHKMIHKAVRLEVQTDMLRCAQEVVINSILCLIYLYKDKPFTSKDELIDHLESDKATK